MLNRRQRQCAEECRTMTHSGKVRAGIGGWTYEPWRGTFYPPGLPHARELEHAASRVSAIAINGTYYRLQKPESFARWAEAVTPDRKSVGWGKSGTVLVYLGEIRLIKKNKTNTQK